MAAIVAVAGAALVLAGCGILATTEAVDVPGANTAGYRVLTGAVRLSVLGGAESAAPVWAGQGAESNPPKSPEVPSSSGKWWPVDSAAASFPRTDRVQLLASGGRRGVRFNLFWEETCGGQRVGRRGVLGGDGGSTELTLHSPALVLIKLPTRYGSYDGCYLAATVSVHMARWRAALAAAPHIKVIHY